jgi:hypothetical protein
MEKMLVDVLEELNGWGRLQCPGSADQDVEYQMRVLQDRLSASSHDGEATVPGLKKIVGSLEISESHRLIDQDCELHVADGRSVRIKVRPASTPGVVEFVGTGPLA